MKSPRAHSQELSVAPNVAKICSINSTYSRYFIFRFFEYRRQFRFSAPLCESRYRNIGYNFVYRAAPVTYWRWIYHDHDMNTFSVFIEYRVWIRSSSFAYHVTLFSNEEQKIFSGWPLRRDIMYLFFKGFEKSAIYASFYRSASIYIIWGFQ